MRSYRRLIAIILIASNFGCASVAVRMGCYSRRLPVYPATAIDIGVVSYTVSAPFRSPYDGDAQDGIVYFLSPVAVIDFPLAIAMDTVLLPYDLYKLLKKKRNADATSTDEIAPAIDPDDAGFPFTPPQQRPEAAQDSKQNVSDPPERPTSS